MAGLKKGPTIPKPAKDLPFSSWPLQKKMKTKNTEKFLFFYVCTQGTWRNVATSAAPSTSAQDSRKPPPSAPKIYAAFSEQFSRNQNDDWPTIRWACEQWRWARERVPVVAIIETKAHSNLMPKPSTDTPAAKLELPGRIIFFWSNLQQSRQRSQHHKRTLARSLPLFLVFEAIFSSAC